MIEIEKRRIQVWEALENAGVNAHHGLIGDEPILDGTWLEDWNCLVIEETDCDTVEKLGYEVEDFNGYHVIVP